MKKFNIPEGMGLTECPLCGMPTNHDNLREHMKYMTVYGLNLEDISNALDYARYHGWKSKTLTESK